MGLRDLDLRALSVLIPLDGTGKPRDEVRLFQRGVNPTENGDYLFDDAEAEAVMAAYAKHGVGVMVDLEHLSLDPDAPHYDPDARGRGRLELRNGELWLVGIKWTPDGTERITSGKQTFVSPAFPRNSENRIIKIINVAITAMPATDFAMPLAASIHRGKTMDPKLVFKTACVVRNNAAGLAAAVAAGKPLEGALETLAIDPKTFAGMAKLLGADANDMNAVIAAVRAWLDEFVAAATGKAPEKPKDEPPAEEPPPDAAVALRASGAELELLRTEASKLGEQVRLLTAERDARDSAERRALVAELVKLGRETPATAWADVEATKPRGMLAAMPVVELRERVALFSSAPLQAMGAVRPAVGAAVLDEREQKLCAEMGCKPEIFAALKAQREAAR